MRIGTFLAGRAWSAVAAGARTCTGPWASGVRARFVHASAERTRVATWKNAARRLAEPSSRELRATSPHPMASRCVVASGARAGVAILGEWMSGLWPQAGQANAKS